MFPLRLSALFRWILLLSGLAVSSPESARAEWESRCITTSPLTVELEAVRPPPGRYSEFTRFALMKLRNRSSQSVWIDELRINPTYVGWLWNSQDHRMPKPPPTPLPHDYKKTYVEILPDQERIELFPVSLNAAQPDTERSYTMTIEIPLHEAFRGVEWNPGDMLCSNACVFTVRREVWKARTGGKGSPGSWLRKVTGLLKKENDGDGRGSGSPDLPK